MSEFKTLFRKCPSCGRRFEVRLADRKYLEEKKGVKENWAVPVSVNVPGDQDRVFWRSFVPVAEEIPSLVDEKEFQYAYHCKHCGHKWIEIVDKPE